MSTLQETGQKFTTLSNNNNIEKLQLRLSVQISLNGLSFLVTNESKEEVFFEENKLSHSTTPEELLMEIESVISQREILNSHFEEVSLVYSTPIYSLVPIVLFDETKTSEYLKFNSKILANDYVAHDRLEKSGIAVAYVPFMNINNFFFEKYGSFDYYHSISILLKTILEQERYSLPRMFLHFQQSSFDCLILKDGKLQLCNTYSYTTPEDFIYYTLFSIEQLKLNPETLPVFLCGDIEKNDPNYEMAYTYIRNLEFLKMDLSGSEVNGQAEDHRHIIIKNIQ